MAKLLARLLDRHDTRFRVTMTDLEKATGKQGIDIKLVGDILHASHDMVRKMGLDSADTTPIELYNALINCTDIGLFAGTKYSGIILDDECISLNIEDVQYAKESKASFSDRSSVHLKESLVKEIKKRYKNSLHGNQKIIDRTLAELH